MRLRKMFCDVTTGRMSPYIYEVMPSKLTLKSSWEIRWVVTSKSTPFKEIDIVPPQELDWPFIDNPGRWVGMSPATAYACVLDTLESHIYENWNPDKSHIVLHSSGYDSRILSSLIKRLYDLHGIDWLGNVMFICTKYEGEQFRQIMGIQGWDVFQYASLPDYIELDFSMAWKRLNGYHSQPIHSHYNLVERVQGAVVDREIQVISGYWGNEYLEGWLDDVWLHRCQRWYYYDAMAQLPQKVEDVIMPFTDMTLSALSGYGGDADEFRRGLANHIAPELSEIERLDHKSHDIPAGMIKQAVQDYLNSWYGKQFPHHAEHANATTTNSKWWGYWSLASLVEQHIRNGGSVEVE